MSRYVDAEIVAIILRQLPKELPNVKPEAAAAFEMAACAVEEYADTADYEAGLFAQQMLIVASKDRMDDYEISHKNMDALMVNKLREFGFGEAMDIFENAPKWYA